MAMLEKSYFITLHTSKSNSQVLFWKGSYFWDSEDLKMRRNCCSRNSVPTAAMLVKRLPREVLMERGRVWHGPTEKVNQQKAQAVKGTVVCGLNLYSKEQNLGITMEIKPWACVLVDCLASRAGSLLHLICCCVDLKLWDKVTRVTQFLHHLLAPKVVNSWKRSENTEICMYNIRFPGSFPPIQNLMLSLPHLLSDVFWRCP
jgi:hypothetical protein